jgi:hypothetical protein
MKLKDLKEYIREEVQTQIAEQLPEIIEEAMANGMKKAMKQVLTEASVPTKAPAKAQAKRKRSPAPPRDARSLASLIGYGDMVDPKKQSVPTPRATMIAGVPVEGGLASYEASHGQAHLRDVPEGTPDELIPAQPVGSGPVPESVLDAIGRAKEIFDRTKDMKNYRPGKRS